MGCAASIMAIGPFNAEVVDYLMYPKSYYRDVPDGTQVIGHVLTVNTTSSSKELAQAFRFELWDFTKHIFKLNSMSDIEPTILFDVAAENGEDPDRVFEAVDRFIQNGFTFIFDPND